MGKISERVFRYDFSKVSWRENAGEISTGFLLKLQWRQFRKNSVCLEIPGQLQICIRETEAGEFRENFTSASLPDGSCPVVEMRCYFTVPDRPAWKELSVAVPLALIEGNELIFAYDTVKIQIFCRGKLLNENYSAGSLNPPSAPVTFDAGLLDVPLWSSKLKKVLRHEMWRDRMESIGFYTPEGFNTNLGDVVLCVKEKEFHLLYLADRRHHGSRWGAGGHIFRHLVSSDLENWCDWGPVFELTDWHQSCGTGSMFFFDGKFHIAYGWHTSRMTETKHTFGPLLEAEWKKSAALTAHDYKEHPELIPSGAVYCTSEDGIHFKQIPKVIHLAENPGMYPDEKGGLFMIDGAGTWRAPSPEGPWHLAEPGFPPHGENSALRNSGECPCEFHFGKWKYLLFGRTGFWQAPLDGTWQDKAAEGQDIYDGLMVPMAAAWNSRLILAGWPSCGKGRGNWGSFLLFRELLQRPDGRLDMRWLPETLPVSGKTLFSAPSGVPCKLTPRTSTLLELEVQPSSTGLFAVRFSDPGKPDSDCLLQLDFSRKEAQFSTVGTQEYFAAPLKSARTMAQAEVSIELWNSRKNFHYQSFDFVLENVDVMDKPFTLRIICHSNAKLNGTAVDVEIAGRRTMVTLRPDWHPEQVRFDSDCSGCSTGKFRIAELL